MERIVSIVPYNFLPAKIGGQKGIALFNEFFGRYVDLTCLTVASNDNSCARHYKAVRFFSDSRFRYINPFYILVASKLIRKYKATHVMLEHPYFGWLGYFLKKVLGVKLVVHSHNIESVRFKTIGKWWWPILWRYEKWTHKQANYNFFIHEADRSYAIEKFGLYPNCCMVATYGIERESPPAKQATIQSKASIRLENGIMDNEMVLLFNGSFNYRPNVDALKVIADVICPMLDSLAFSYKVVVCGPWLEEADIRHPNLIIKGFVDSIETYFQGADVFLNPVIDGGGIKTKLVEALGNNCNAVSTTDGATGVSPEICNGKLLLAENGDWVTFCHCIVKAAGIQTVIGNEFYEHFYWGNTARKAAQFIQADNNL